MPQTSSSQLQQLHELAIEIKDYIDGNLLEFLDMAHTAILHQKFNVVLPILNPVETFELEVKHKLSAAAHEILQAVKRIDDSQSQNTKLDIADYLRYARVNLEEAEKDITAAHLLWNALNTYINRIEKQSPQLATTVHNEISEKLISMLEQTNNYKKEFYEKILLVLNQLVAGD